MHCLALRKTVFCFDVWKGTMMLATKNILKFCLFTICTWQCGGFHLVSGINPFFRSLSLSLHPNKHNAITTVTVPLDTDSKRTQRSYPIYISSNLLTNASIFSPHVQSHQKILIVSNTKVGPLYSATLRKTLQSLGKQVYEIELPDGEEYKDIENCFKILEKSLTIPLDRKSLLIALGGGVIGDMGGFAASIYQRGIAFLQIPTSLMAMVDSSVGGKTAVNHPLGKNMIGSFYQPKAVFIDITTLSTLPDREYRSGIGEVIKYGLIKDFSFFEWIEKNAEALIQRDSIAIQHIIQRSCENKASIVAADEKEENGVRALLNLGHTFGHAIETGFGYGVWLHGEAVTAGMMMAADLSLRQNWIDRVLYERLERLLIKFQLPIDLLNQEAIQELGEAEYIAKKNRLTKESFYQLMTLDKKVSNGRLHLILLKRIAADSSAESVLTEEYSLDSLQETISRYCSSPAQ